MYKPSSNCGFVYRAKYKSNGKRYVGKSVSNLFEVKKRHKKNADQGFVQKGLE